MQFIFLQKGVTASLIPIYTLIEHKPQNIIGCILLGERQPDWFRDSWSTENPAKELLHQVNEGQNLSLLHVFLIVKEPNFLLNLTVLVCTSCCSFNFKEEKESSLGGKKLLELLVERNILTYPAEVIPPDFSKHKHESNYREAMQDAFGEAFNIVASAWLPNAWGLKPVSHYN